jgi:DNA-binding NarL/FixJ family response regulator
MNSPIRVVIAEDHKVVRNGYVALFQQTTYYKVIGEAEDGVSLLKLLETCSPDIILLDVEMPRMGGYEVMGHLRILYPNTKVVVLSVHYSPVFVAHFFLLGARAYLHKGTDFDCVLAKIDAVIKDGYAVDEYLSRKLLDELIRGERSKLFEREVKLNDIEIKVLNLICMEKNNQQIADQLNINVHSVDYYRRKILTKTRQSTVVGIVKYAIENGLNLIELLKPGNESDQIELNGSQVPE